jgi:hypothetical protein
MMKAAFNRNRKLFTSKLDSKLVKCYIWGTAMYGAKTWTLLEVDQENRDNFGMWSWGRLEIRRTAHVGGTKHYTYNEGMKDTWIGHSCVEIAF